MAKVDELNLKIEYLPLSELKPYENNPRKNDKAVKPLAESIKQFGFSYPITINDEGVIISGHTRYKAAKLLKLKTVPCVRRSDLTPEQERALRLVDNQISGISEWDFMLREDELAACPDIDFSVLGFETNAESYIDDLFDNGFAPGKTESDEFGVTFLFPINRKDEVDTFIKDNGKEKIVKAILDFITGGGYSKCLTVDLNVTSAICLYALIIMKDVLTAVRIVLCSGKMILRTLKTAKVPQALKHLLTENGQPQQTGATGIFLSTGAV